MSRVDRPQIASSESHARLNTLMSSQALAPLIVIGRDTEKLLMQLRGDEVREKCLSASELGDLGPAFVRCCRRSIVASIPARFLVEPFRRSSFSRMIR